MIVGCSADSAMQIYVAAAARQFGVPGIVYTARRAKRSAATQYAIDLGCEVIEVGKGAYLSTLRSRAKARALEIGDCVRWDPNGAIRDTINQCQNIPHGTQRVVVPTGSGLICAGVMAGLAKLGRWQVNVLAVAVSKMATPEQIVGKAQTFIERDQRQPLPQLTYVRAAGKYEEWVAAVLPDGSVLDPYYAAKALHHVRPGDCLWLPGLRPLAAMPAKCVDALARLSGLPHAAA